jgi:hypothetical protein
LKTPLGPFPIIVQLSYSTDQAESTSQSRIVSNIVDHTESPVMALSEGNLATITETIPIDISVNPGVVEHIHLSKNVPLKKSKHIQPCSRNSVTFFLELRGNSGIDPSIIRT